MIAVGTGDGAVSLWDTETRQQTDRLTLHGSHVFGLSFSQDGALLASIGMDGALKLRNVDEEQSVRTLRRYLRFPTSVTFSQDSRTIAVGSMDGLISLLSADTGMQVGEFQAHDGFIGTIVFTPDDQDLLSFAVSHFPLREIEARVWRASPLQGAAIAMHPAN